MSLVTVTLDTDLAVLLQELNQPIQETAREMIILELYRRGSISSGKAAQLLDMSRWEFIQHASQYCSFITPQFSLLIWGLLFL